MDLVQKKRQGWICH